MSFSELIEKARRYKVKGPVSSSKPPSGYHPVPGSKRGGWRKWSGKGYDYWYPSDSVSQPKPDESLEATPAEAMPTESQLALKFDDKKEDTNSLEVLESDNYNELTDSLKEDVSSVSSDSVVTPEEELKHFGDSLLNEDEVTVTSRIIDVILSIHSLKLLKAIRAAIQSRIKARGDDATTPEPKKKKKKAEKKAKPKKRSSKPKGERTYTLKQLLAILDKRIGQLEAKSSDSEEGWERMPDDDHTVTKKEFIDYLESTKEATTTLASAVLGRDKDGNFRKPKKDASVEQMEALASLLQSQLDMANRLPKTMKNPPNMAAHGEVISRLEVAIAARAADEDTEVERIIQEQDQRAEEKKQKIKEMSELVSSGTFEFTDGKGFYGVVTPDPTESGRWRVTRYDSQGLSGHTAFDTVEQAVTRLIEDRQVVPAPGTFDKMAPQTPPAEIPKPVASDDIGEYGEKSHLTRQVDGLIPIEDLLKVEGARGEHEAFVFDPVTSTYSRNPKSKHANRYDKEKWDALVNSIRTNGFDPDQAVFIVSDPGKGPQVYEGNHRIRAAHEAGLTHIPARIRYFGHTERDYKVSDVEPPIVMPKTSAPAPPGATDRPFWHGDEAIWTGNQNEDGFWEVELIEGHRRGQTKWVDIDHWMYRRKAGEPEQESVAPEPVAAPEPEMSEVAQKLKELYDERQSGKYSDQYIRRRLTRLARQADVNDDDAQAYLDVLGMRTDHEQSQNVTRDKRAEQWREEREAARFKPDDEYYQRRKNTILSAIQGTIDNARKHSHKQARVAHEAQYNSHVKELKKVQSKAKEDGFEVSFVIPSYPEDLKWKDEPAPVVVDDTAPLMSAEAQEVHDRLTKLENDQAQMKAINRVVRGKKLSDEDKIKKLVQELKVPEGKAYKLVTEEPRFGGKKGFPAYMLTNNNATIKRLKDKLATLLKEAENVTADYSFEGGYVTDNQEDDRVQIFFDFKPDSEIRRKLKGSGWRWAPSVGAWQRKRTENARYSAMRILDGLSFDEPRTYGSEDGDYAVDTSTLAGTSEDNFETMPEAETEAAERPKIIVQDLYGENRQRVEYDIIPDAPEPEPEPTPDPTRNKEIADTIIEQLGGYGPIRAMTGAKHFMTENYGVSFGFPNRLRSKPNHVKITLNSGDLYDVQFGRKRTVNGMPVIDEMKRYEGMYGDRIQSLFEEETGLYLQLFPKKAPDVTEETVGGGPQAAEYGRADALAGAPIPPSRMNDPDYIDAYNSVPTPGEIRQAEQEEMQVDAEVAQAVTNAMAAKKTKGKRKEDNQLAIDLIKKIVREGRAPTDEERVQIASYSGKGGISGDLNQFYTRTDIAGAMWEVMRAHNGEMKTVLEPACGSGVFIDQAPKGTRVTGVELDSSASAVSDVLHGHTHDIQNKSLEEYTIENMGKPLDFDAVVTNAPFCVRTGEGIPKHKTQFRSADRYFIDTSLDHCKDGGMVAMIVHSSVMNAKNPAAKDFRERMLARAEVVDSFRLPGEAFDHSHTQPITDVIFLRKRDSRVGNALLELQKQGVLEEKLEALGAWDSGFVNAEYYEDKPERILGKAMTSEETGWRDKVTGDPEKVASLIEELSKKKIESGSLDAAATPISHDQLLELGELNTVVKEAMEIAQGRIDEELAPPELGNVKTVEGTRYLYVGEPPKWTKMQDVDDVSQIINNSGDEAIKAAHEIADDIRILMGARDEGEFYRARNIRRRLVNEVKNWVEEHGLPASHKSLNQLSKSAPQLLDFIACVDSNGQMSDLLSKDAAIALGETKVDKSDFMSVVRSVSRQNNGYVTVGDVVENWETMPEGKTSSEIRRMLLDSGEFALDPSSKVNKLDQAPIQHIEDYLTGNLFDKLSAATEELAKVGREEREQYEKQIETISEQLDAKRKSIDDVPIQLRAMGWLPLEYFNAYLNSPEGRKAIWRKEPLEPGELMAKMHYEKGIYTLQWVAPPGGYEEEYWERVEGYGGYGHRGVQKTRMRAEGEVLRQDNDSSDWLKYMNRLSLRKEKAQDVEEFLEKNFNEWLKSSDLRTEVEDLYNKIFNSEFRKEYSNEPLGLEGLKGGIVPHGYQNQAVRWAAETGRGILGQDVGLGKTFIAILLARLRRQQGTSKRPMVVVPKSVATNWAEETETLFPGSRVLVIGETRYRAKSGKVVEKARAEAIAQGFEKGSQEYEDYVEANRYTVRSDNDQERNRKLAMMKQNDYDLIICTKPAFDRIPLKAETTESFEKEDFHYQRAGQLDSIRSGSSTQETRDKKIAKLQASWSQDKLQQKFSHEESLVYWEDLGVDTLMADEAHAYKNLYAAKSRYGSNPKFLGGSGQSMQARKMQHMARVVRDAKDSNGVFFLTATPTKNSPLEVFNMLQHIAPEAFQEIGISNSEQFIDRFCQLEERLVLTPPGKSKKKKDEEDSTQFAEEFEGAGNMVAAQCVTGFTNLKELETIMDKYMLLQTATDVGLKIPEAQHREHLVDMSEEQRSVYSDLRAEAADLDRQEDPGGMFRIMDRMKKAAQDLELYDPVEYKDTYRNSPKYTACVNNAFEGAMERGGQIVFCDHNASHERLKAMLMEKGLKEHEIGIINAQVAKDSEARQRIGNKFNRGEIKVVIGNTGTMGEGVNLQGKKHDRGTTDIHHLDQPWDPGTMHQRNGRGVRQGNRAENVQIHTYLARGSFDGFRHSTLKGKERWLDKLRSGADNISNDMEGQDLDEATMLAMLSDDPDAALEKLKQVQADATSAFYARAAQESIDDFYKFQRKLSRYNRLKGQADSKQKMELELERLQRKLMRSEVLPEEIKLALQEKGLGMPPVAVTTSLVGVGDAVRMGATLIEAGTVLDMQPDSSYRNKLVVTGIDLTERKIHVRRWGSEHGYSLNADSMSDMTPIDATAADELKEVLSEREYQSPIARIKHLETHTLAQNTELVQATMRDYYRNESRENKVVIRLSDGSIVATDSHSAFGVQANLSSRRDAKEPKYTHAGILCPWDKKDRDDMIEAVIAANSSDDWNEYQNPVAGAIRSQYSQTRSSYGYTYGAGGNSDITNILKDAEKLFKKRKKMGKAA